MPGAGLTSDRLKVFVPPTESSAVLPINVKDPAYGAVGDGVTDDTAAIMAAVTAANGLGTVYFPAGTYYLNNGLSTNALALPASASGLTIQGAGIGATVIKCSSNTPAAFTVARASDNQTFQNITIQDLTVDANNVTGSHCVLFGTLFSGSWLSRGQKANFSNIKIRRCATVNVPTGTYADGGTSYTRQNISLVSYHPTTVEPVNTISDILVEDCQFAGGNAGVVIMGAVGTATVSTTTTGTNSAAATSITVTSTTGFVSGEKVNIGSGMTYEQHTIQSITDSTHLVIEAGGLTNTQAAGAAVSSGRQANVSHNRITVRNVKHDALTASYTVSSGSHVNVQLGGVGYGGTCRVEGIRGFNSGDIGVETDGFMYATHVDCYIEDARGGAYLSRNFQLPEGTANNSNLATGQRAIYRDCHARVTSAGLAPSQAGGYEANGWQLSNSSTPSPMFGEIVLEGCSFRSAQAKWDTRGQAVQCYQAPVRRITIRDFTATCDSIAYTSAGTPTIYPSMFMLWPDADGHIDLRDIRVRRAGAITISAGSLQSHLFNVTGLNSRTSSITVDGVYVTDQVTGTANGGNTMTFRIGDSTGTLRGSIKRVEYLDWPSTSADQNPRMFSIRGTGNLTISGELRIEDCDDFTGTQSGFSLHFPDGGNPGNRDKVYLFNNRFKNTQAFGNWPHASAAMDANSFGSAAFTTATGNQYLGGMPAEVHFATGTGAAVTAIAIGKTSGTFEQVYAQASGVMAQDVLVPVDNGDYVKVTFATTQPTTRVRPRRL